MTTTETTETTETTATTECDYCGDIVTDADDLVRDVNGGLLCGDCAASCDNCGDVVIADNVEAVMGGSWCTYCMEANLRACTECSEYTDDWYFCDTSNNATDCNTGPLCYDCYERR